MRVAAWAAWVSKGRICWKRRCARGLRVTTIFVAQGAERLLDALPVPPETEILRLPAKLLDSALATETPQPIAALVEPPDWSWPHILDARRKGAR